jgi:hypothetical protein
MRFWRTLHYRLLWLTPVFTLIGGGEAVGSMMFYAIGSDVTPQAKRSVLLSTNMWHILIRIGQMSS